MTPTDLKHMHDAEMQGSDAPQAPERIWFTKVGQNIVPNSSRLTDEDPEYLRADLAPDRAAFERMREALKALEREASNTIRIGAQTGPHWTKLSVANLRARAALKVAEERK